MVAKYPSNVRFDKEVVDAELRAALAMWEGVSKLTFIKTNSTDVDIRISFVQGEHEDHTPFDGPRGYLAHAFFLHTVVIFVWMMMKTGQLTHPMAPT